MKKRIFLLVTLFSIMLISGLVGVSVAGASDPFIGAWDGIDTFDGSYNLLIIGRGPADTYRITYIDFGATACGVNPSTGDILFGASLRGFLTLNGNALEGVLPIICQSHPPYLLTNYYLVLSYDASSNTLWDGFVLFHRR